MNDYSNENAPVAGSVDESTQAALHEAAVARQNMAAVASQPPAVETPRAFSEWRSFVSPNFPDSKHLVVAGKVLRAPDPNSPEGFREFRREGDVWAIFAGGVCTTNDPRIIAWCEQRDGFHKGEDGRAIPAVCVDANDPRAQAFVELTRSTQETSRREPALDPGTNVAGMVWPERFERDHSEGAVPVGEPQAGSLVEVARTVAREHNEAGHR